VEYVLLVALLSTLSVGFLKFFAGEKDSFFIQGLSGLGKNASGCMTHADAGGTACPDWRP
jgi:hypothetical protein